MATVPHRRSQADIWRLALPGLSASLVGIGLARFAYTPLLPAIISHGWFDAGSAAYLGAANLAGYLIGVIGAAMAARRVRADWLLRASMVLATASFFACAWPAGFVWFSIWRLISGIVGGVAMVLAAPAVLPHVPPAKHGLVSGSIFMGIGLGIALSGTVVPLLLREGLTQTWLGLGVLAGLVTAAGWNGWMSAPAAPPAHHAAARRRLPMRQLRGLYGTYALIAFALVPHMVFLVDYVARGLHQGLDSGAQYWVLFGIGAIVGPLLAGRAADLWGHLAALYALLFVELVSIGLPALTSYPVAVMVSSFLVGACTIGTVTVALGRSREILQHHPSAQTDAWRTATTGFALFQAGGAYALSFLLGWSGGNYRLLFALGAAAIGFALVLALATQGRNEASGSVT